MNGVPGDQCRKLVNRAEHGKTLDTAAVFGSIIVHEPNQMKPGVRSAHLLGKHVAGEASPNDARLEGFVRGAAMVPAITEQQHSSSTDSNQGRSSKNHLDDVDGYS